MLINQTAEGKIGDSRHPARADEGPTELQSRFLPPPAPAGITFTPPHSQYRVASMILAVSSFLKPYFASSSQIENILSNLSKLGLQLSGQLHKPDFRTNFRLSSIFLKVIRWELFYVSN